MQPNSLDTMPTSDSAATATAAAVVVQEASRSSARCCPRGGPQCRPLLPTQRPATPPAAAHAAVRNIARCCPQGGPGAARRPSTQLGRGRVQFRRRRAPHRWVPTAQSRPCRGPRCNSCHHHCSPPALAVAPAATAEIPAAPVAALTAPAAVSVAPAAVPTLPAATPVSPQRSRPS
jgi:hypothetical protein